MLDLMLLAQNCAPGVAPQTMTALVRVESENNPYAIGVVGGRLARQPVNLDEAMATAKMLETDGWNFSLGLAQVNRHNLPSYEITYEQAFDPCTNLRVGSKILEDCFKRASKRTYDSQKALHAAFSCYYSGNFSRGFKPDVLGKPSYVQKILASAGVSSKAIPLVPSIDTNTGPKPQFDKAALSASPAEYKVKSALPPAEPADNDSVLIQTATPSSGPAFSNEALPLQKTQADNAAIVF
ncbi:MAG: lytic transglycosylase domain-containing protein [Proteobacteria bacterium]|nr:MAG: lytic transglycosylase domain-containing protein [Pseudomonadota bacterium]